MRTTINLNDNIVKELIVLYNAKTKTDAVNKALSELIKNKKKQNLLDLRGKIDFYDNLNELNMLDIQEMNSNE